MATGRNTAALHSLLPEPLALIGAAGSATPGTKLARPPLAILQQLYRRMVIGIVASTLPGDHTHQSGSAGGLCIFSRARSGSVKQARRWPCATVTGSSRPTETRSLSSTARSTRSKCSPYLEANGTVVTIPTPIRSHRSARRCATNTLHNAVGFGQAAAIKGEGTVAVVLLGDGATSEGDTHEALNFAAVRKAPVVFFVQNNGYAISVPSSKQTAAPTLAHKAVGYGMPGKLIDGNDAAAVYATTRAAIDRAADGCGPTLIEAITYRMEAHTNADDPTRYRDSEEVDMWLERDPIDRLEKYLRSIGELDDAMAAAIQEDSEQFADEVRRKMNVDSEPDPSDLFQFVYAEPTPSLLHQREELLRLLDDEEGPP